MEIDEQSPCIPDDLSKASVRCPWDADQAKQRSTKDYSLRILICPESYASGHRKCKSHSAVKFAVSAPIPRNPREGNRGKDQRPWPASQTLQVVRIMETIDPQLQVRISATGRRDGLGTLFSFVSLAGCLRGPIGFRTFGRVGTGRFQQFMQHCNCEMRAPEASRLTCQVSLRSSSSEQG